MKLLFALLLAVTLLAQNGNDPRELVKESNSAMKDLIAKDAQLKADNERLTKLLAAWQQQAINCIAQSVNDRALTPQQPAPAK